MKFENVLKKVKDMGATADLSSIDGLLAIQVTLTGNEEGIFYIEVKDGVLSVEPYEYHDRQANIIISNEDFCKLMTGKLDPVVGFTLGRIKVEGDLTRALLINKMVKPVPETKEPKPAKKAEKKPVAKKPAKKAAAKPVAEKPEVQPVAKITGKTTATKKPAKK